MRYAATFGTGWKNLIAKILISNNIKIVDLYDGLVIFDSEGIAVKNYPFFNNIYYVIDMVKNNSADINKSIMQITSKVSINFSDIKTLISFIDHKTFKIKAFKESKPVKIDYKNLSFLEDSIKNNTRMKVDNNPDIEFIFLQRSEGITLFLMKLTYNRITEKNIKAGSLRPEVCSLLIYLANITEKDIIIDPFCGYGAIPKEIIKRSKYNMIFASDIDEDKVKSLRKEYKNNNKNYYIKTADSLNITYIEDGFIDKIITDPPWNIYNKRDINMVDFYSSMLIEFYRILKKDGKVVILMGNPDDFETSFHKLKLFSIIEEYSVLINGKKANVYLLEKI